MIIWWTTAHGVFVSF